MFQKESALEPEEPIDGRDGEDVHVGLGTGAASRRHLAAGAEKGEEQMQDAGELADGHSPHFPDLSPRLTRLIPAHPADSLVPSLS